MSIGKLTEVRVAGPAVLKLHWDDGFKAELNLAEVISAKPVLKPLADLEQFSEARLSDDGWSVEWPCGIDFGSPQLRRWATNGFDEHAVA